MQILREGRVVRHDPPRQALRLAQGRLRAGPFGWLRAGSSAGSGQAPSKGSGQALRQAHHERRVGLGGASGGGPLTGFRRRRRNLPLPWGEVKKGPAWGAWVPGGCGSTRSPSASSGQALRRTSGRLTTNGGLGCLGDVVRHGPPRTLDRPLRQALRLAQGRLRAGSGQAHHERGGWGQWESGG